MKKQLIAFNVLMFVSAFAFAKGGGGNSYMGGLGYQFADPNSFINPGQMALNNGAHLEVGYDKVDGTKVQALTPSFAWANGHFGFGLVGTRYTTDFADKDAGIDVVGAALGVALANQRLTAGVEAHRSISTNQTNDGYVNATINLNGQKRMGFSLGVNAGTTLNNAGTDVRHGGASLGWGFSPAYSIEAHYEMNNFSDSSDYTLSGFATAGAKNFYCAAGVNYGALTKLNEIEGRLGLNFGTVDISARGSKTLDANYAYVYGGTIRVNF